MFIYLNKSNKFLNYLAHIYLSNNNTNLIIGNFIADFITGNKYKHLPLEVQKGILLHRQIDSFTDNHIIFKTSKRRLDKRYGHYKGIIIDILYDHFLAKNWTTYSEKSLINTEKEFIILMKNNLEILPEKVLKILPYIEEQNWLSNYATLNGIEKSLIGVNKRTKLKSQMHLAINDLKENYFEFENDFTLFFKDLIAFTNTTITKLDIL